MAGTKRRSMIGSITAGRSPEEILKAAREGIPNGEAALAAEQAIAQNLPIKLIPIGDLEVSTYQQEFFIAKDSANYQALKASIAEHGMLERPIVTPKGDRYLVGAGATRLAIAKELGWAALECAVAEDVDSKQFITIFTVTNTLSAKPSAVKVAFSVASLLGIHMGMDERELIERLKQMHNSRKNGTLPEAIPDWATVEGILRTVTPIKLSSFLQNYLPLLGLHERAPDVLRWIAADKIEHLAGLAIARLPEPDLRERVYNIATQEKLSLKDVKELVESKMSNPSKNRQAGRPNQGESWGSYYTLYRSVGAKLGKVELPKEQAQQVENLLLQVDAIVSASKAKDAKS